MNSKAVIYIQGIFRKQEQRSLWKASTHGGPSEAWRCGTILLVDSQPTKNHLDPRGGSETLDGEVVIAEQTLQKYFQTDKRTMVKINIKYQDESEFWFETSTSTQISDLARDVNVIFKNKHLLHDLVKDVEKLMDQQPSLAEQEGLGTSASEETASSLQEQSRPVCF